MNSNCNYVKYFLLFIVAYIFIHFQLGKALAIQFFDGVPTTILDINDPQERLFGGADSDEGIIGISSTNLTISTQKLRKNVVNAIFGGGHTSSELNRIDHNIWLKVQNTNANQVIGGSLTQAPPFSNVTVIGGSIYMDIAAVEPTRVDKIIGGCLAVNQDSVQSISGSIHIGVKNINGQTFIGLGNAIGPAPEFIAVKKNLDIKLSNSSINYVVAAGEKTNVNLGGNVFFTADSSNFSDIWGTKDGNINGFLFMGFKNCNIDHLKVTDNGTIHNFVEIDIKNSRVSDIILGPVGISNLFSPVTLILEGSTIKKITAGPLNPNALANRISVSMLSGSIDELHLGSSAGTTKEASFLMLGGTVRALFLGDLTGSDVSHVGSVIAEIGGGTINFIITGKNDYSELKFISGVTSNVLDAVNVIGLNTRPSFSSTCIQRGAKTIWGAQGETFRLGTKSFELSGRLSSPPFGKVELFVKDVFVANGGSLAPVGLVVGTPAPFEFVASPGCSISIVEPLKFDLSLSPELMGFTHIPIVKVSSRLNGSNLFNRKNRRGLLWDECELDPSTNTWYVNNIRPSQDFYGISAAREATSWLRQEHILGLQKRSSKFFDRDIHGLWIETKGGYERLDTPIGKSKMPWVMASIGYDFLQTLYTDIKAIYGVGFGYVDGQDRWNTVNTSKHTMHMGLLGGYIGIMHHCGLYGTANAQISSCRILTKSPGFDIHHKWTETVPTESLGIGWEHALGDGFIITPRGQIIFEQLSKHRFNIPIAEDTVSLKRNFLTTSMLGVTTHYDFPVGIPVNIEASVDWIKGITGDFASQSNVLKRTFKDKNDSSVLRAELGFNTHPVEYVNIFCKMFFDTGDDKGIGGQLQATYAF